MGSPVRGDPPRTGDRRCYPSQLPRPEQRSKPRIRMTGGVRRSSNYRVVFIPDWRPSDSTLAQASVRVASLLSSADSLSIGSCLSRQDRDRGPSGMRARASSGMLGAKLRRLAPVGLVGAAAVASVFVLASLGIGAAAAKSDGIRGGAHGILFSFAQPSNANNAI